MKPTITRSKSFQYDAQEWTLTVPGMWLVRARWPRLQLTLWLLRLVWSRAAEGGERG